MENTNSLQQESMLRVGTLLRGIYRIDSYLSSGGFGNTYVATNVEFNERYAIKEFFMKGVTQRGGDNTPVSVSNSINQDSFLQQKEKFKKEARRLRQLNNPHIVKVHDLFEENGTAYYVMDYVDGENLSERLRRMGQPIPEKEACEILSQILDALKAVHDAGIWHLDLKPANIMVDKTGQVKLIDFGASKQMNTQKGGATTSTAISYTNGYAPREQMEQNYDKFGPWTDLYALGATLYNLMTNIHPPKPSDIDDDMSEDKHLALPMPHVSDKMKQLVVWLMRTNRMQRPQSVTVVSNKLLSLLSEHAELENDNTHSTKEVSGKNKVESQDTHRIGRQTIDETIIDEPFDKKPPVSRESKKSGKRRIVAWGCGIPVALLIILLVILMGRSLTMPKTVTRMNYKTAIGGCQYSGPVDKSNRPNGIGEAFFNDGRYYKGNFDHGILQGSRAYFKYGNGDVFEGEFRDNFFYFGIYTIAKDGSSFHGYYKRGQPSEGQWLDKNGKIIK